MILFTQKTYGQSLGAENVLALEDYTEKSSFPACPFLISLPNFTSQYHQY